MKTTVHGEVPHGKILPGKNTGGDNWYPPIIGSKAVTIQIFFQESISVSYRSIFHPLSLSMVKLCGSLIMFRGIKLIQNYIFQNRKTSDRQSEAILIVY